MRKISVADAARELKMNDEEFLKKLREMGVYAEDAFTEFRSEDFDRIKAILNSEGASDDTEIVETRIRPGIIRRRAKRKRAEPPVLEPAVVPEKAPAVEAAPPESELPSEKPEEPKVPAPVVEEEVTEPEVEIPPVEPTVEEIPEPVEAQAPPEAEASVEETSPEETAPEEAALEEAAPEAEVSEPEVSEPAVSEPVAETPAVEETPKEEESAPAIEAEATSEPETPPETELSEEPEVSEKAEAAEEVKAAEEKPSKQKAPEAKPEPPESPEVKRIRIRGVTKEPARVLEKPSEALTQSLKEMPGMGGPSGGPADTGRGPRKRGRTVVEVVPHESAGPRKKGGRKRDIQLRELKFDRRERLFPGRGKKGKGHEAAPQKTKITTPKAVKRILKIQDSISVGELSKRMGIKGSEIIRYLMMNMGTMVTLNQALDFDTATLVASEFGFEVESAVLDEKDLIEIEEDAPEAMEARHPVVTVMGHVDHGKTSLLEAIRKVDNMLSREAGGITQHIGAYNVSTSKGKVTFLDTPGHEAFTEMRARGAKATDIVILVVAADDGVMPQTKEAINHAQAAEVPIIVAVNKIDKPEADIERVKQALTAYELVPEEWGGETQFVEVSAKQGTNIEALLDSVLLQAEVMELKANPSKRASGIVIEAKLERGRGPVATVLIQQGTLKQQDPIVAGQHMGRVRMMSDHRGRKVNQAGPSMAVEVIGISGVPSAGDLFNVVVDEKRARQIAELRLEQTRNKEIAKQAKVHYEDLHQMIESGEIKDLNIVLKADVHGSIEAITESLQKLSTDEVKISVIHSSVGAINETDVNLASASNAILVGFNVRPHPSANVVAEREGVQVKLYTVIYDVVNEMRQAMIGLLEPQYVEVTLGRAEVRNTFTISKIGTIGGSMVLDGKIRRGAKARLIRDGKVITESKIGSLRRFKDDAKEVSAGLECGIGLENFNDIKLQDIIEAFDTEEVTPEL